MKSGAKLFYRTKCIETFEAEKRFAVEKMFKLQILFICLMQVSP